MKFSWKKKSLIISPNDIGCSWASHSLLTPTPFFLSDKIIRIYCGFRGKDGMSRIGFVDVDSGNPSNILGISESPCLDVGDDGHFDDNGMILGDVIKDSSSKVRMYYVGFQLVKKAKFLAFTGVAESSDGTFFSRVQDYPVLDRAELANTINAVHSVYRENGEFFIWHAKGNDWALINGKKFPKYDIWCSTSNDGLRIKNNSKQCIKNVNMEYRIGRPSVFKHNDTFIMFYTKGTLSGSDYFPGVALSQDGFHWQRADDLFGLGLSKSGWDSKQIAYPRALPIPGRQSSYYVFYNGNNMGETGFGYAKLHIED